MKLVDLIIENMSKIERERERESILQTEDRWQTQNYRFRRGRAVVGLRVWCGGEEWGPTSKELGKYDFWENYLQLNIVELEIWLEGAIAWRIVIGWLDGQWKKGFWLTLTLDLPESKPWNDVYDIQIGFMTFMTGIP